MTQEIDLSRNDSEPSLSSREASDDEEVVIRKDRASVREMILRFERTNTLRDSSESLAKSKDPLLGSLTSVVNPIPNHFQHLCPVTKSLDRNSNVSVNSILSNTSEHSCESSSSGFISDRKSIPHRPAPPPPVPIDDETTSPESKSPPPEVDIRHGERRYSYATPNSSPILTRRSRQPPVMRKKSTAGSQGHSKGETPWSYEMRPDESQQWPRAENWSNTMKPGSQENLKDETNWPIRIDDEHRHLVEGEKHWSYGVKQSDLEKLLRLKRSEPSDNEEETKTPRIAESNSDTSSDDSDSGDNNSVGKKYILSADDTKIDTISTDHSTDTLIDEERDEEGDEEEDDLSVNSDRSDTRSNDNYDDLSIKSISSFDMIPYQKYDSITVSSDEFGSEVCHAPDSEFLTVSAVNEWCVLKAAEPVLIPVVSKKEKYRR